MKIVFRTDASRKIGSGHVMRCITLAKALQKKGADIHFICREHDGHFCGLIEQEGIHVFRLPKISQKYLGDDLGGYASWLGCSWEQDAQESSNALQALSERADWLIVDHYALNEKWEKYCCCTVKKIMVIDDLAKSSHHCNIVLNQNILEQDTKCYNDLVPNGCAILSGPKYALLQESYANLNLQLAPRQGKVKRVLVFFGLVDNCNLTGRTLTLLQKVDIGSIEIDVVVGLGSPYLSMIFDQAKGYKNINIHTQLPTLSGLMARADLAIGGCGATTWERMCVGLPSLVITLAANQRSTAQALHERGLIVWLGDKESVSDDLLRTSLIKLIYTQLPQDWSSNCAKLVDGKGVNRVCTAMQSL